MAPVTTASALEQIPSHGSVTRPNMVSVGTIVWLSSELMFFAALFAMYFTIRSVNTGAWPPTDGPHPVHLNLALALPNTIILVLSSDPYGSVYYLTTGFHGLHVAGGLLAFIVVLLRSTYGRFTPADATSAIVVSYYWHFVDVVWIGLFTTIYLIR